MPGLATIISGATIGLAAFYASIPVYYLILGELPPIADENDPAAAHIFDCLYPPDYPLASWTRLWNNLYIGLALPALMKAPRVFRIAPCLVMAWKLIYVHTIYENQAAMEATGLPIPVMFVVLHFVMTAIWLGILILPDPPRKPTPPASTLAKVFRWIVYGLLALNMVTVWVMFTAAMTGTFPDAVADREDAASVWVEGQVFTDDAFQCATMGTTFMVGPLLLLALPGAPQVLRIAPALANAVGIVGVNNYLENKLVLEAIGVPMNPNSALVHTITAVTCVLVLFLPEPGAVIGKPKRK